MAETGPITLTTVYATVTHIGTHVALFIPDTSDANPKAADNGGKTEMMRSGLMAGDDISVAIVSSRRVQDGVEIFEREVHLVDTCDVPVEQPVTPRLVITDALSSATEYFVSKTRAEIDGLTSFINSLRPMISK